MNSPSPTKVAMDAAYYAAAGYINREAEPAVQRLKDGILMPVTHKNQLQVRKSTGESNISQQP